MHYGMRNQRAGMLCPDSRTRSVKWQVHGFSLVALLMLIVFCVQSQGPSQGATSSSEEAVMEGTQASSFSFLGRNYKQRHLEQQMIEKDREIRDLKYQISRAMLSTKLADTNTISATNMISLLQEREQTERQARTKAQYALAEKIAEYSECAIKRDQLETRLTQCGDELMQLSRQARQDAADLDGYVPRSDSNGIPLPETVQTDSAIQAPRLPHQSSAGRRRTT